LTPCPLEFLPDGAKLVPIHTVVASKSKPRAYLNILELRESIAIHGIRKPLTVSFRATCPKGQKIYEIIDGHRRKAVAQQLNFAEVPIAIIGQVSQQQALEHQLATNRQNRELSIVEEAKAILQLLVWRLQLPEADIRKMLSRLDHFGDDASRCNVTPEQKQTITTVLEAAGRKLGDFRTNLLPFLNYHDDVQDAFAKGLIGRGHAKALGRVENNSLRQELLYEAAANRLTMHQIRARLDAEAVNHLAENDLAILQKHIGLLFDRMRQTALWQDYGQLAEFQSQLERLYGQYC
jgi:ParB family chromosome partitioning protein